AVFSAVEPDRNVILSPVSGFGLEIGVGSAKDKARRVLTVGIGVMEIYVTHGKSIALAALGQQKAFVSLTFIIEQRTVITPRLDSVALEADIRISKIDVTVHD